MYITTCDRILINGKKINVPIKLNDKWMNAAFLATLLAFKLDNRAVTHVPILLPNRIGIATCKLIAPVAARDKRIAVDAEELCTTAVIAAPTKIPKNMFPSRVKIKSWKNVVWAIGLIASFI